MNAPLLVAMIEPRPAGPLARHLGAVIIVLALVFSTGAVWLVWDNRRLQTTQVEVEVDGLEDLRIAHVSDLHGTDFGTFPQRLLDAVGAAQPDLIALTGDLIDIRTTDLTRVLEIAGQFQLIAPTYLVLGNHEADSALRSELLNSLREAGVTVLRNETAMLEVGGQEFTLVGLDDPRVAYSDGRRPLEPAVLLPQLLPETTPATILLAHRPELLPDYARTGVDLVLSGHAHGGQVRLPLIGGLFAPHQGWFPDLTAGVHTERGTTMVISRGLGNSVAGVRVNNARELVIIDVT